MTHARGEPNGTPTSAKRTSVAAAWAFLALATFGYVYYSIWILSNCESSPISHFACADVGPWGDFLDRVHQGLIPYRDFSREYPVGVGTIFWWLGAIFGTTGFAGALKLQVGLSLVTHLGCAALLYRMVSEHGHLRAALATALFVGLPTALLLAPLRYESLVALVTLAGYAAHRRGRHGLAAGIWSFGFTLKWYPIIALAIAELQRFDRRYLRTELPRIAAIVGAVVALANGPYIIADWMRHGHVQHWLQTYTFHAERALAPDTVLGAISLWLGPLPAERHASVASLCLAALVVLTRRRMELAVKFTLVCLALLAVNRVYSPQFHLWFYPLLLCALGRAPRNVALGVGSLLIVFDVANVAVFPVLYSGAAAEMGGFGPGAGAALGGPLTAAFTSAVLIRAFLLLALVATLYAVAPRMKAPELA
ncbi:MAG: hypothetical protein PVI30_03345 [Myxococcales bacterium]|jgi:hypothetical protein